MHCVSFFGALRKLARELDWLIGYKVFLAARPHSVFNRSLRRLVGSVSSMNSSIRHIPAIFTILRLGSGFIASSLQEGNVDQKITSSADALALRATYTFHGGKCTTSAAGSILRSPPLPPPSPRLASIMQIPPNLKFTACPRNYTSSVDFE